MLSFSSKTISGPVVIIILMFVFLKLLGLVAGAVFDDVEEGRLTASDTEDTDDVLQSLSELAEGDCILLSAGNTVEVLGGLITSSSLSAGMMFFYHNKTNIEL